MENGESNRSRGQEFGTLGIIVFLSTLEVKLSVYPRVDGLVADANGTEGCPRAFKWLSPRRWGAERHAAAIAESEGRLSRVPNPKVPQSRNPSPQEMFEHVSLVERTRPILRLCSLRNCCMLRNDGHQFTNSRRERNAHE